MSDIRDDLKDAMRHGLLFGKTLEEVSEHYSKEEVEEELIDVVKMMNQNTDSIQDVALNLSLMKRIGVEMDSGTLVKSAEQEIERLKNERQNEATSNN